MSTKMTVISQPRTEVAFILSSHSLSCPTLRLSQEFFDNENTAYEAYSQAVYFIASATHTLTRYETTHGAISSPENSYTEKHTLLASSIAE